MAVRRAGLAGFPVAHNLMKKIIITLACFSVLYLVVSSVYKGSVARGEARVARVTGGWMPKIEPDGLYLWEFYKDGTALRSRGGITGNLKGGVLTRIETRDEQNANWAMDGDTDTVIEVTVSRDMAGNPTGMTRGDTLTARLEPVGDGDELVFEGTGRGFVKTFAKHKGSE